MLRCFLMQSSKAGGLGLEAQPQNRLNLHRGQGINSEVLKAKQGFYSLNDLFPGIGHGEAFTIPVTFGTRHHTLLLALSLVDWQI